nr:MAG TPA: hypothetical protein [Caudoviricetes sp.]
MVERHFCVRLVATRLFIGNVFYVVWLDPDHQLYPGK